MRTKQCEACPWRKDVKASRDIPNGYCVDKHKALESTLAEPDPLAQLHRAMGRGLVVMACHESPVGHEDMCVGWLVHQLGPGNNLALRMLGLDRRFDKLETFGEQHERFEDTLT